jgi:hypothetical protein
VQEITGLKSGEDVTGEEGFDYLGTLTGVAIVSSFFQLGEKRFDHPRSQVVFSSLLLPGLGLYDVPAQGVVGEFDIHLQRSTFYFSK